MKLKSYKKAVKRIEKCDLKFIFNLNVFIFY